LNELIFANPIISNLIEVIIIGLITWLVAKASGWLAVRLLTSRKFTWRRHVDEKRLLTLRSLVSAAIKVFIYIISFIVILFAFGIPGGAIVTALGLFSAGFGLGARPLINDYLAGMILIFEDQFAVGDKVEMLNIIGVVETVDLRTTHIRSTTGELYIIPNGDVRVVRNLSRGLFSVATLKVTVATKDLSKALQVLEEVADTARAQFSDLIERPEFLSIEGAISAHVELTFSAKAKYGRGARLRTQLMAMVTDALDKAEVRIIS